MHLSCSAHPFRPWDMLQIEYVPLGPGAGKLVSELWPLYAANGERNGLVVLPEAVFRC